ncbi:MAG: hypothetical protein ABI747_00720 [Candidatus Moraniibacteriota bacterium]
MYTAIPGCTGLGASRNCSSARRVTRTESPVKGARMVRRACTNRDRSAQLIRMGSGLRPGR